MQAHRIWVRCKIDYPEEALDIPVKTKEVRQMRITVDIPEEAFLRTKTAEEIAKEAREAAILYWVVRGEMDSARIVQFAQPGQAERLWNALDSMPDVGSDEDFARSRDFGRSPPFGEAEAG